MKPLGSIQQWQIASACVALAVSAWLVPAVRADIPYAPVMIYYDQANASDNDGKISANALRNLLGHFKTTVDFTNLNSYAAGQLNRYKAVFYIGSDYSTTNIPVAFDIDVRASTNTIVWIGGGLWWMTGVTSGTNRFGIHYAWGDISNGYDAVRYKGIDLVKNGSLIQISVSNFVQTLATATSTTKRVTAPYAVRSSNFWYIADNPLASQQLGDRSLVLADLLHDMLGSGTNFSRRGVARIEDSAPALTSKSAITAVSVALRELGVNATFGIIPRYRDPLGRYTNEYPADVRMSENRDFLRTLRKVLRDGGEFAAHGYTHESGDAESGSGYEFWSTNSASPLAYDSSAWCAGRVTNALTELLTSGFPVTCWETPHYMAALDDYPAFSETFRYSHERARTFAVFTDGMSRTNLDATSAANPHYSDQWFPYVIQKSCYGNTFLPENIDRFSLTALDANGAALSVSNKVLYAQRLAVVRDGVLGFYFHPQYGPTNLTNIVRQVMGEGYTFVSPLELSRDEPVALYTNAAWAASNTVRAFTTVTNLFADLMVGDVGAGNRVTITNGVAVASEEGVLGLQTGARSNLVYVAGTGSMWTSRRILSIGRRGSENGVVVRYGGNVHALETVLGLYPESSGNAAVVSESGSVWSNHYGFTVGYGSASNGLAVMTGGRVCDTYGEIGATTNANGNFVTVMDPGSLWSNLVYVVVGNAGAANTLTIQSSGRVSSAFGLIGARSTAASNAVQVIGPGSCWTNAAGLRVGVDARCNSLTISNGGAVACASAVVGDFDNAAGNRIDIEGGNATLQVQQSLTIGADSFENVVRVAQDGILQCGSIIVGRDDAGPDNELVIDGGTVMATGAVQVLIGRLTLTAGALQADSVSVARQGEANLGAGFQFTGTMLTNQGVVIVAPGTVLQASLVLAGNGRLGIGAGETVCVSGDFLSSTTNTDWSLAVATLAFTTSATHRLSLNAADRGAVLSGFDSNQTLGGLTVEGDVVVTNVCYIWNLAGSGTLRIGPGARVYCATLSGWSGSVMTNGDGAFLQVPLYPITATAGPNGDVTPTGVTTVTYGSSQGYTMTPLAHYHVAGVDVDGVSVGATNSYTFVNVTNAHTIYASFAIDPQTLTVVSAKGGAVPGTVTTNYGTALSQFVINSPVSGGAGTQYVCVAATVASNAWTQVSPTNVTLTLTNDATLTWQWKTQYALAVTAGPNGSVMASNGWYDAGSVTSVTAVASNGYRFVNWTGTVTTNANPLVLTLDRAHAVTANFAINLYEIASSNGVNGTIAPSGSVQVAHGASTNFTMTPSAHYHVAGVDVDGVPVGATNSYTFVNVTNAHTIYASFAIDPQTLTVVSAKGGAVPGTVTTNYGTALSQFVINSPVSGGAGTQYVCVAATVASNAWTQVSPTNVTLTLTNNATLVWRWQTNVSFTCMAGPNGTLSGSSNGWYQLGGSVTVTASPASYYHFSVWTGTVVSASNPLSLSMDRTHSLLAQIAANLAARGTPEWWLAQYGWTNSFGAAETNDADHDGSLNWQEWVAGTDPTNPSSVLSVTSLHPSASGFVLRWPSVTNRIYGVGRATNLIQSGFSAVVSNILATPPINVHTDQVPGMDKAFYRINVEKP